MIHYLGVRFSKETNRAITQYRTENNLANSVLPALGWHTTIAFSKTPFTYTIGQLPQNPIGVCRDAAELYRTSIVLQYDSPFLQSIYRIIVAAGATTDYELYKPHITIAEECGESQLSLVSDKPNIPVIVTEIFYKEWPDR